LTSRNGRSVPRDWDLSLHAASRVIGVDSLLALRYALAGGLADVNPDVERVVLDRTTSAPEYLSLLASLPPQFAGDVLLIANDDSGFMSSLGRSGDRVLYALSVSDVRLYLQSHGLVTGQIDTPISPAMPMIQHRPTRATA
jgi:hypothetical protein